MKTTRFFIPGEPMAKQRPQVNHKTKTMYTPKKTLNYESLVAFTYDSQLQKEFWDCEPMEIEILSLFAIPKSYSKKLTEQCLKGKKAPSQKDVDNIAKSILDGLNGVAYSDDKHIMKLTSTKMYTSSPNQVGVYICIKDFIYNKEDY